MTPAEDPRHTPTVPIRVGPDLWAEFGRLAGARNRSEVVRQFIRWYVRERGAKLPQRPDAEQG
jgi:metal-responsive CopG/Arc/MetJ family transcriptional regulator